MPHINSDFRVSLQIGHEITYASAPGGTMTNCDFNCASSLARSAFQHWVVVGKRDPCLAFKQGRGGFAVNGGERWVTKGGGGLCRAVVATQTLPHVRVKEGWWVGLQRRVVLGKRDLSHVPASKGGGER
jgi:hypothetical protein